MKSSRGLALLAAVILTQTGCSWLGGDKGYFRDRSGEYTQADELPVLQLPVGVRSKQLDPLLPLPPGQAGVVEAKKIQRPHTVGSSQLEGDFSIQRSGRQSWISAQRIPAEVWNLAQAYFHELGFAIAQERPDLGEFSTDWLAESALPQANRDALRLSKNQQVRYLVRLQPGALRNSTDLFVESAVRKGEKAADWNAGSAAVQSSNIALTGLERYFSDMGQQRQGVSLLSGEHFDAPRRVTMVETEGLQVLRLDSSMDRAWSGVGRSLNAAGIYVEDVDRSLGLYYVDLSRKAAQPEPGFFKRLFSSPKRQAKKTATAQYQVRLTQTGDQVFVTLETSSGALADAAATRRVLGAIQPHLN